MSTICCIVQHISLIAFGYFEDFFLYKFVCVSFTIFQAFASSITGTLAAQALLKGYGVGDESATVIAATFTWLLKSNAICFIFHYI